MHRLTNSRVPQPAPESSVDATCLWWHAFLYVMSTPTNVILVLSSVLGYYMFACVRASDVQHAGVH